jgi:uncharacterized membrane protein YfcA
MDALLPPDLGMLAAAILLALSFVTSLISAAFGIGGGVVMIAVLGSLLPPLALIPIHAVVQAGSCVGRAALMFRSIHWVVVPPFVIGALVGASIGGLTVVNLSPGVVQLSVGLFIIWSIFFKPPSVLRRSAGLIGVVSTFLTMFFGATGPFVISYIKGLGLDRMYQVGTHAALMSFQHVAKTLVFAVLGFAFGPWIWLIAGLILTGLLGTIVGQQVLNRTTDARFAKVLNVILFVLAARLIYAGATSLWTV